LSQTLRGFTSPIDINELVGVNSTLIKPGEIEVTEAVTRFKFVCADILTKLVIIKMKYNKILIFINF
jgi:hypothetical protein